MWRDFRGWQGLGLIAVSLVATVWFAATGRLTLFIHPRYVVFTVVMAIIGLLFVVAAISYRVRFPAGLGHGDEPAGLGHSDEPHEHEHEHEHEHQPGLASRSFSALASVFAVAAALALLLLPATTLSVATAQQRAVNVAPLGSGGLSQASGATAAKAATASTAAFARFTVQDWSSLLRESTDPSVYEGKPVDITGFISANPADPAHSFYLSRFVITCCAVDAQPLGVPVSLANWKSRFAPGQWLHITGGFGSNPSPRSSESIVLNPTSITRVAEPSEPYLY